MNAFVENLFNNDHLVGNSCDICEHKNKLRDLTKNKNVVEFGVRHGFSTVCFLMGCKSLISYDIVLTEQARTLMQNCPTWQFNLASSTTIVIPECDVLFIDTDHTYEQLTAELNMHHNKAKESIIMHDTYTDCMRCALNDFMHKHPEWKFSYDTPNNNGLTVITRS